MLEHGYHRQAERRCETMEVWVGQFVCPRVEVALDMPWSQLHAVHVQLEQNLHEDDRGGHLLAFVVEKRVHVPLVVTDQGDPEVRNERWRLFHEKMGQNEGAKHL